MTIQDAINWLRAKLRDWLGVKDVDLSQIYSALRDQSGNMIDTLDLKLRIETLETAYAADPRRAEIAKEKAEQPNHIAGFTPRSKRIAAWQDQRRAEPKK